MITLTFLNWLFTLLNQNFISLFRQFVPTLNSLTTWLTTFSVPQTFIDFYSLTWLFLPLGTFSVLFGFTIIIISAKFFISFIHFISLGLVWGE